MGVAENLICGVLGNYLFEFCRGILPLPRRWLADSGLPPNHDLERVALGSLRKALQFGSDSLAAELEAKPSRVGHWLGVDKVRSWLSGAGPSPVDEWIYALNQAIRDPDALEELAEGKWNEQPDWTQVFAEKTDSTERQALFHEAVARWARQHAGSPAPAGWEQNLQTGFRAEEAREKRIALYDVWLLFLREELKDDERPFRAFMLHAVSNLRAQLPAEEAAKLPEDAELAERAVSQMRQGLDESLRAQRVWMGQQFADLRSQLDRLSMELVEQRKEADRKHQETSAFLALVLRSLEELKGAGNPAVALQRAAAHFEVEPRTAELGVSDFVSNTRRNPHPLPEQAALGKQVERAFHVKPVTTKATKPDTAGVVMFRIAFYAVFLIWGKDATSWLQRKMMEWQGIVPPKAGELKTSEPNPALNFPKSTTIDPRKTPTGTGSGESFPRLGPTPAPRFLPERVPTHGLPPTVPGGEVLHPAIRDVLRSQPKPDAPPPPAPPGISPPR